MKLPTLRSLCVGMILDIFRPSPKASIAEWVVEQKIVISGKENATYRGEIIDPNRTPAVSSLVLGFLHPDDPYRELHFVKSAQSATSVNAVLGSVWNLKHRGGNILYLLNTGSQITDFASERLTPLLGPLSESDEPPGSNGKQRTLTKSFSTGTFYLASSGSINNLTGKPIAIGISDETERNEFLNDTTVVALLRTRLTAADESKLLSFSTPEEEAEYSQDEQSGHWNWIPSKTTQHHHEYLKGSQSKCHVPCPYCGTYQEITWEKIQFSHLKIQPALAIAGAAPTWDLARMVAPDGVYMLCDNDTCRNRGPESDERTASGHHWNHGKIYERHKKWMITMDHIRWVPTPAADRERADVFPQADPEVMSAQLSSLYDVAFASLRWGALTREWIKAQGDPRALRFFVNNRLGRPMQRHRTQKITDTILAKFISPDPAYTRMHLDDTTRHYRHTNLPLLGSEIHSLSLKVDVQQNVFKWQLQLYTTASDKHKPGEIMVLDWGQFPHDADRMWRRQLNHLTDTIFTTRDGHTGHFARNRPAQCMIDARYHTTEILDFCFQSGGFWQPVWGEGDTRRTALHAKPWWIIKTPIQDNLRSGHKVLSAGREIDVIWLDVPHYETELMHYRLGQSDHIAPDSSPRIHLPHDVQAYPNFLAEILNAQETHVQKAKGRIAELRWTKVNTHAPDDHHDNLKWGPLLWDVWKETPV